MKILFISNYMQIGGIETNIVLLTKEFTSRGHEVFIISSGGVLEPDICSAGGKHITVDVSRIRPSVVILRKLNENICKISPDIIHVFSATTSFFIWLSKMAYFNGRFSPPKFPPIISSIMGLQKSPDESTFITQLRIWMHTLGTDKIIVTSPAIMKYVERLPIKKEKLIERIVCGIQTPHKIDSEKLLKVRQDIDLKEDEFMVITIGALEFRKSHGLFIDAARNILSRRNDVKFFIVGEGSLRSSLERKISNLGLQGNLRLLGMRKDVLSLLSASDVCVKPGILDGFLGITVLEAQSLGVPVVAFEGKDIKEAIQDKITGILVPKKDVEKLSEAIGFLLDNKEIAKSIGQAGQKQVFAEFAVSGVAESLLSLYNEVISSR